MPHHNVARVERKERLVPLRIQAVELDAGERFASSRAFLGRRGVLLLRHYGQHLQAR